MVEVMVPGSAKLRLEHLVLDFNGTLAIDGVLIQGVADRIARLAGALRIHVLTGDTFGTAAAALADLPCDVRVLQSTAQGDAKRDYVLALNAEAVACIGNGRNDRLMMAEAALAIAVLQSEGASAATLAAADVVAPHIRDALDLLLHPLRLTATLRG
jgi:soluble P-type ATPase